MFSKKEWLSYFYRDPPLALPFQHILLEACHSVIGVRFAFLLSHEASFIPIFVFETTNFFFSLDFALAFHHFTCEPCLQIRVQLNMGKTCEADFQDA